MKVKRTSIADLIRPLRDAKERERERDKEREMGRGARSVEDANISNDATTTEGNVSTSHHLVVDGRGMTRAPVTTLTRMTLPSETSSSDLTIATSHDLTTATLSNMGEDAVFFLPGHTTSPVVTSPVVERESSGMLMKGQFGGTLFGERRLKVTTRSLREGKSQSLILLTGSEPEDKDDTHCKVSLTGHAKIYLPTEYDSGSWFTGS